MPRIAFHEVWPDSGSIPIYNGGDSCATAHLDEIDRAKPLPPWAQLMYDFERSLQGPVLEMQMRGFRIDPVEREAATKIARAKRTAVEALLGRLVPAVTGEPYLATFPNSTKQLTEFFYRRLGISPIREFANGATLSMDRNVIERLEDHFYARPFALGILLLRDLDGTLEVLEREIDPDWRWRCSYNIAGTTTFRFSSSASALGTGSNFQNISEGLRRIFIPDPGWKLCGIDLEQADAREVGLFCGLTFGDWTYLDACESGDLHTYVTRLAYPSWAWTGDMRKDRQLAERRFYRHHTYRDANKRLGHGTNFYGKPRELSTQTKIPLSHVREFQEKYFDIFPCIRQMHRWHAEQLQRHGYVVNSYGVRRDFLDRKDSDDTLKAAIAYTFQSATSVRNNRALEHIWRMMGDRVQVLAQLHDANYFQYRTDDNEKEVIEEALKHTEMWYRAPNGRRFNVPGEAQVGFNWAHRFRRDDEGNVVEWNPNGLDKVRL